MNKKGKLLIISIIVLSVIVIIISSASSSTDSKIMTVERLTDTGGEICVYIDGKETKRNIAGQISLKKESADHEKQVISVKNGDNYECLFIDKNNTYSISQNAMVSGVFANNDSTFVFKTEDKRLLRYSCSSKKTEIISEYVDEYAVSPDSKSVIFTNDNVLFLLSGKKVTELGSGYEPLCVSDSAMVIYAIRVADNSIVTMNKKGEDVLVLTGKVNTLPVIFSEDSMSCIVSTAGGTYYCTSGKEKTKISSSFLVPVTIKNSSPVCSTDKAVQYKDKDFPVYFVSTRMNMPNTVYLVKGPNKTVTVDTDIIQCYARDDQIAFVSSKSIGYLYKSSGKRINFASGLREMYISPNGKTYCLTDDNTFGQIKKTSQRNLVDNAMSVDFSDTGIFIVITNDNKLYVGKNGQTTTQIQDNVVRVIRTGNACYCFATDKTGANEMIYSADCRNFDKSITNIKF